MLPRILHHIATDTAAEHELGTQEIYERTHAHRISHPRQEAMLRQREAGYSYGQIAAFWGYDHTTVIHACRSAASRREPVQVSFRSRRVAA